MSAKIEFFPVDNGDMTLISLESGRKVLIDCNIRNKADNENDGTPDVGAFLRDRLERDDDGRLYVDTFLLSHPDMDHCSGLEAYFHTGKLSAWSEDDDKIVIREMWSSPIAFRRKDRIGPLCADAEVWRTEAKRRAKLIKDGDTVEDGDRLVVLGHDVDDKSDDLEGILVSVGETITEICGLTDDTFTAVLLGPIETSDDEDLEELLAKNRSSTIIQFSIDADGVDGACKFLTGGDAEVNIWEKLWESHHNNASVLEYDVLQAPHHCSWHVISEQSWSEHGENAELSGDALSALSQAQEGAIIVSSSKSITDDDSDPPCIRAEREYVAITDGQSGQFVCVADHVDAVDEDVLTIDISASGVIISDTGGTAAKAAPVVITDPPRQWNN